MPEPITILASLALGAMLSVTIAGAVAIAIYLIVKVFDLIQWFREKKSERLSQKTQKLISGSVGAKIKNGDVTEIDCGIFNEEEEEYQMVQYIYDPENDKIVEARGIRAKKVSNDIEEAHRGGRTAIYKNF